MRDLLRILRDLQELDEDLYRVRRELEALPRERQEKRSAIDTQIGRKQELDAEVFRLRVQIKELEDGAKVRRQRIRQLETASGNTRADQALIAAYSHEIRNLKREISDGDEKGLQLVEKADAAELEAKKLGQEIEASEKVFAEFAANVEAELARAQARADTLGRERRERIGNQVPSDVLGTYDRLLEVRGGVALAALDNRTCQGCHIQVPTNIYVRLTKGRELVQCPKCQRILYTWD
jgi:predicted  nucleic acid-binding Zn-ribbon protein